MSGAVRGRLSVRKKARRVAVLRTKERQDRHVEDSLTFGKKDGQTWMRYEKNLNRGTIRGIPLHHA